MRRNLLIGLGIGILISGVMYGYSVNRLKSVMMQEVHVTYEDREEQVLKSPLQLEQKYKALIEQLEELTRTDDLDEMGIWLNIAQEEALTRIRINQESNIGEEFMKQLLVFIYQEVGLTYDQDFIYSVINEKPYQEVIEVNPETLVIIKTDSYKGKHENIEVFDVTIEIPHHTIVPMYFRTLHEAVSGEGYILDELVQEGGNDLVTYEDIPIRERGSYWVNGIEQEGIGMAIDIEIEANQIRRVSGRIVEDDETQQVAALKTYQVEMLNRLLDYWGVTPEEQAAINELLQADVARQGGSHTERVGRYIYTSRAGISHYNNNSGYHMKFDVTLAN